MLKIVLIVLGVIVVGIAGLLLYATTRPDQLHVERSASIKALPDKIFPLIEDLHSWQTWSPYEKRDPAMKRTYSGAERGQGAIYEWDGDSNVGQGRMEIIESAPAEKIAIKLDFIRPFEGHNTASFVLKPEGEATQVTWSMDGPTYFMGKLMGIFINMDRMIGTDFEAGLANLKSVAEK